MQPKPTKSGNVVIARRNAISGAKITIQKHGLTPTQQAMRDMMVRNFRGLRDSSRTVRVLSGNNIPERVKKDAHHHRTSLRKMRSATEKAIKPRK